MLGAVIVCPLQGRRKSSANDPSEKRNASLVLTPERDSERGSWYRKSSLNIYCPKTVFKPPFIWALSSVTSVDPLLSDRWPGQGRGSYSVLCFVCSWETAITSTKGKKKKKAKDPCVGSFNALYRTNTKQQDGFLFFRIINVSIDCVRVSRWKLIFLFEMNLFITATFHRRLAVRVSLLNFSKKKGSVM